jgi:hypothetical protein
MPATPDHKAEMFTLAQERRRAGKPSWEHRINLADIFHNDDLSFAEKRDAVVRRLRATTWFKAKDEYDSLSQYVEELSETEDIVGFGQVFDAIYDEADYDRAWIATF